MISVRSGLGEQTSEATEGTQPPHHHQGVSSEDKAAIIFLLGSSGQPENENRNAFVSLVYA